MTSLAAPVVLVAGAALAMTVPVIALKELLLKRFVTPSEHLLQKILD